MEYKSISLKEIIKKIEENEYILPNFQRGFVWDENKQKKLIASFIVKIPIGSTLHLEGKKNDFAARGLCEIKEIKIDENDSSKCIYILDGQQRLSTLKNCFFDLYSDNNWKNLWDNLFNNLRIRWFLKIDNDFFGYEKLKFDKEKLESTEPQKLLDYIISRKILKTKDIDKWWHPNFTKNKDNYKVIREEAAKEKLIPLFELFKEEQGLHKKILQQIANNRILDIKQDIENAKAKIEDFLNDLDDIENELEIEQRWTIYATDWANAVSTYLNSLLYSKIPSIILPSKEMGRAAAIFEEINKGGLALSTYDLLVAKTAKYMDGVLTTKILESFAKTFDIKELNNSINWQPKCMLSGKDNELSKKFQEIFLNTVAVLIYGKIKGNIKTLKKEHLFQSQILEINGKDIVENLEIILDSIKRTYAFLQFRLGIIKEKNIRYSYMILPMIYLLSYDEVWKDKRKLDLLEAWYWSSFFSGEFRDSQDEKFIKNLQKLYVLFELPQYETLILDEKEEINSISVEQIKEKRQEKIKDWINSEENIIDFNIFYNNILENNAYSDLNTLINPEECPKAMEDAILQYCLSQEPKDFMVENANTISAYYASCRENELHKDKKCKKYKLEIHHIIPLANSKKIGYSTKELRKDKKNILNSPLNLVYISECANRMISDLSVEKYLDNLGPKISDICLNFEKEFYKRKENENEKAYYERLLRDRYEKIKSTIKKEIRDLVR